MKGRTCTGILTWLQGYIRFDVRSVQISGRSAQIGDKRRAGMYGAKPSLAVDHTLDRPFDIEATGRAWIMDITVTETEASKPMNTISKGSAKFRPVIRRRNLDDAFATLDD